MPATLEAPTISPRTGRKREPGQPVTIAQLTEDLHPAPKSKTRSPEVEAIWAPVKKQIDAAFKKLPPMDADSVHLHRQLRTAINSHIHSVYLAEKAFPKS
jgi:hypothetical protein